MIEQMLVGRAGADRTAQTLGGEVFEDEPQIGVVDQQILRVDGQPVAEGRGLGRLEVGERHTDEVRAAADLTGEGPEQFAEVRSDRRQGDPQAIGLNRVLDIHRGGPEVQLAPANLRLRGKDADFRHQVVVDLPFDLERGLDVDPAGVSAEIGDFFL